MKERGQAGNSRKDDCLFCPNTGRSIYKYHGGNGEAKGKGKEEEKPASAWFFF
jgi:hypothetical protein